ncbi:hypothetical protein [Paenibacillus mucilaginosus]|uniref:Uncharacterized protein n=2 Tax=Paenibacillus mucilaginosus TaxID=61624 RepID=I0BGW1_9BACL|nr:hypothetical protein [Paenibacillus mucilaginosus]AEI40838.1 hypothetical protein KNP414_02277 [Paenibacillus mucilaginosus KNP414]AFH61608.1 hypothetical protein B2K_12910 [Paenibacillus mucilaginosus K02]MCG7211693.1 hypothetical protein [Paenibacillus mucilaginosus]WDM29950.1 hypothetical protein KCX80_12725 [Paenibacillus mucilaginosus]
MLALLERIKQHAWLSRSETPDEELQHLVEEALLEFFVEKKDRVSH